MNKKIIIFLISLSLAFLIALYFFVFKNREIISIPETFNVPAENPSVSLSSFPVAGYYSKTPPKIIVGRNGSIFSLENNSFLSNPGFDSLSLISFSSSGDKILAKISAKNSSSLKIFDLKIDGWKDFYSGFFDASFSPFGAKIAYQRTTDSGRKEIGLVDFSDVDNPKQEPLLSLNISNDYHLSWLDENNLFILPSSSSNVNGQIFTLNIKNKTLSLFSEGSGLVLNWDYQNQLGFLFKDAQLSLIDSSAKEITSFSFSSMPEKCALKDKETAFCSVPSDILTFPEDYYFGKTSFDSLYKINLKTQVVEKVAMEKNFSASKIFFISGNLYFIDGFSGFLKKSLSVF